MGVGDEDLGGALRSASITKALAEHTPKCCKSLEVLECPTMIASDLGLRRTWVMVMMIWGVV